MAYQSWSVVYGEQPTAAKWNILGTNDASFNDGTGIGTDAIKVATHLDNPYRFKAYKSSSSSSISSGTSQTIIFDSEKYDPNGDFDTTTGKYTAPITGYYHFDIKWFAYYGGIAWGSARFDTCVYVDGSGVEYRSDRLQDSIAGKTSTLSFDIYLTAGQVLKVNALIYYSSGAPYLYGDGRGVYTSINGHLICT